MQAEHVQSLFKAMSLQPEDAASVAAMLRAMPWPESDTQASLTALSEACARSGPIRAKLQSYLNLQSYFTEAQWDTMLGTDSSAEKLELLLTHLVALGLRNPDERTLQLVTALYLKVTQGAAASSMAGSEKHANLVHVKKTFKRMRLLPAAQLPTKLPANPAQFILQFPVLAQVAFAEPPVAGKYPDGELTTFAACIPMRRREARIPMYEFGGGGGSGQLTQAAAAMMQQMQQMQQMQSMTMHMLARGGAPEWPASPLAAGVMAGLVAPPPMRALPARSASSGSLSSGSHALPEECFAVGEETPSPMHTPSPMPHALQLPLEPPAPSSTSQPLPPPLGKKMSVEDATQHILKAMATKSAAKPTVCKKPAANEAVLVDEPSDSEEEPPLHTMKRPAGKGMPHYGIEHTRKQVMCRTGGGGKGSSFAIPFGSAGLQAAKKKAEQWLAKELEARG